MSADAPGLGPVVEELRSLLASVAEAPEGGGRTSFVVGDEGSGVSVVLHALVDEADGVRPRPAVLAGGFRAGRYAPWEAPPKTSVRQTLEQIVTVMDPLVPYAGLIGQVISKSRAARGLVERLVAQGDRFDPAELAPRLLRQMCAEGPVLCVVDDAHLATDGWWADLMMLLAGEVAANLPLLLVLGIDGPAELGEHDDDEPDHLYAARRLVGRGLAGWHPIERVTVARLRAWTGPARADVLESLIALTGGRSAWLAQQWDEWRSGGIIVDDDGRWHFSERGRTEAALPAGDVLVGRLRRSLSAAGLGDLERARELLSWGAQEGRRFTANALARALGRETDEVVDLLDDGMVIDLDHPDGLLVELDVLTVEDEDGVRHLWRYEFDSELVWLALRHHGLTEAERDGGALGLARALRRTYGGHARLVAFALERLYDLGGDTETAARFRRMGDIGVSRATIVWRGRKVLADGLEAADRADRRRDSQILIAAANEIFHSGPFGLGAAFADRAVELAPLESDRATALYVSANHHGRLGDHLVARANAGMARDWFHEHHDRHSESSVLGLLASLDLEDGAWEDARRQLQEVLRIRRSLGDRDGELSTRLDIGHVEAKLGNDETARAEFVEVFEARRSMGDHRATAAANHAVAFIDRKTGALAEARARFEVILDTYRELSDRYGEAVTRHELAQIALEERRFQEARDEFLRVAELRNQLGDRYGEAYTRHGAAFVLYELGDLTGARAEFVDLLSVFEELGDRDGIEATRGMLDAIDRR